MEQSENKQKPKKTSGNALLKGAVAGYVVNELKQKTCNLPKTFIHLLWICSICVSCSSNVENKTEKPKNTTISPALTEAIEETDDDFGKLVGVWYDAEYSEFSGEKIGYKMVLMDDGILYFGDCEINKEKLEYGARSERPPFDLTLDGDQYLDQYLTTQTLIVKKNGDLVIKQRMGPKDTYKMLFLDTTVVKRTKKDI